ncbi:MAG TPA: mannose-1-phosphate guanylyltransferase [Acidobacteriota bacterium]|nr:mannose-1-phosphate guanylyltransferase [Acidobacteriota bacterium]
MKAVIMAGGRGTRFWPLSRQARPKQFLDLFQRDSASSGSHGPSGTLLQRTAARLRPLLRDQDLYVACGEDYAGQVQTQLPQLPSGHLLVEPVGRNTAPCAGLAAACIAQRHPGEVMALLPSDHLITEVEAFQQGLEAARELARQDWLVTFGIRPTFPATGYGYLKRGDEIGSFKGETAFRIERFVEKPGPETAQSFLKDGRYDWNSGMFVWKPERLLEEIALHLPEMRSGLDEMAGEEFSPDVLKRVFPSLQSISVDFGIMEKADKVAGIPCSLGWSDVGSWRSLQNLWPGDQAGLASNARLLAHKSRNVLVLSDRGERGSDPGKLTALVGVGDLIVVDTPDALLICHAEHSEEVKEIVRQLEDQGLEDYL